MATISKAETVLLRLSGAEYFTIARCLVRNAKSEEELQLAQEFTSKLTVDQHTAIENELFDDAGWGDGCDPDFQLGDSVVLLDDFPPYTTVGNHQVTFNEGDVFEVREVYEDDLLVAKHGKPFGRILSKKHFAIQGPAPRFEDVDQEILEELEEPTMDTGTYVLPEYSNLRELFSK